MLFRSAQAELITYDIVWNATTAGNAVGSVTIDTALAPNNGGSFFGPFFGSPFSDFSVTLTGTSNDGTYTNAASQILLITLNTSGFVDYTQELIGQGTVSNFNFNGTPGNPTATTDNTFRAIFGSDEEFVISSITPIPAPSALALLGLASLATSRRRR